MLSKKGFEPGRECWLVEFSSVVDAVRFAVEVQPAKVERNADVPEDRRENGNAPPLCVPSSLNSASQAPASSLETPLRRAAKPAMMHAVIEPLPVPSKLLNKAYHPRRQNVGALRQHLRQHLVQEPQTLPHGDTTLEKEGADLVNRAGSLANETGANPVQSLQVELLYCLYRNKRMVGRCAASATASASWKSFLWLLRNGLTNCAGMSFTSCPNASSRRRRRWRAGAGLHPDQTRRDVGKASLDLATRQLLPQHDLAALSQADRWNLFLPLSMPNGGDASVCTLAWDGSSCFTSGALRSTAGSSH
jgi:hypothetical protein